jgi:hypothetical protein
MRGSSPRMTPCECVLAAHTRPSLVSSFTKAPPKKGRWSAGRRQRSWPRHANGCYHPLALRARRAPQNDPLARTACFGRAAPPGAPPRLCGAGGRPPSRRTALAPTSGIPSRKPSFIERDLIRQCVTYLVTYVKRKSPYWRQPLPRGRRVALRTTATNGNLAQNQCLNIVPLYNRPCQA